MEQLRVDTYQARVERGFVLRVQAYDWNCPQHITPRYTIPQVEEMTAPLVEENRALRATSQVAPRTIGSGPLDLVICGVRQLTPRVRAFELHESNGNALPPVEAGSHLPVPVQLDSGETQIRHYSICSDPVRHDLYTIAVLREDQGKGGSRSVHQSFGIGTRLRCGLPQNHFRLHPDARPAVLVAGGIGITPIKAMIKMLKARGNVMQLHYAARTRQDMAFREQLLNDIGDDMTTYDAAEGERMDIEQMLSRAPVDAVFYVCGPQRLTDAFSQAATSAHIEPARIRVERFSAAVGPDEKPIQVELRATGKQLEVSADQSILDAMLDAGIDGGFQLSRGKLQVLRGKSAGRRARPPGRGVI